MKTINLKTLIASAIITVVMFIASLSIPTVLILAISAFIFHLIYKISMEIYKQFDNLIKENVELKYKVDELEYLLDEETNKNTNNKKYINYLITKSSL